MRTLSRLAEHSADWRVGNCFVLRWGSACCCGGDCFMMSIDG